MLEVTQKEIEKYSLDREDILFVRSSVKREGVAVCSMFDSEEQCLFSSFMIRAKPDPKHLVSVYLSVLLRTPSMRKRLIAAANTATITNISQPNLARITLPVPPIHLQKKTCDLLHTVSRKKTQDKKLAVTYDIIFNALVQRAFRGDL